MREQDDQFGLTGGLPPESESEDSSEQEQLFPTPAPVGAPKKKSRNRKKKSQIAVPAVVPEAAAKVVVSARKEKTTMTPSEPKKAAEPVEKPKKKKKNKSKNKGGGIQPSNSKKTDNSFDELLEEFAPGSTGAAGEKESKAPTDLASSMRSGSALRVNLNRLDGEQDLKRLFGNSVSKTMMRKRIAGDRTHISRRDPNWPTHRAVMSVEKLGQLGDDGAFVYGLVWSEMYAQAEEEFLQCVASNQPSTFVLLLQRYGYHAGALLQLATLSVKSGQFEQAADLLERAVHFFEISIGSSFRLDDPLVRMPHAHRENQALFVTLFKWCTMQGKKGATGSALECCKMMLSWDHADPLDFILMVDNLALRSEQYQWLVDFYKQGVGMKRMHYYPNMVYGRAFALQELGREKEAHEALVYALTVFPECSISIMKDLGAPDGAWMRSSFFSQFGDSAPEANLNRAVKMYCSRSKDLWRVRKVQSWVAMVAGQIADGTVKILESSIELRNDAIRLYSEGDAVVVPSLIKHMLLAEEDTEAAQIPANILQEALNMDALNRPPPANSEIAMARLMGSDAHMPELAQQIEELRRAPTANAVALFLHSLLPWNDPNAPPGDIHDDETLMAQARALLGIVNQDGNNNNNNVDQNDEMDDEMDDDENNNAADQDSSHTEED